jgi:hypothetical protein
MDKKRKATIDEIKVWYRFKPELNIWFSNMNGKSRVHGLPDETWYDGYWFNTGYFVFLQLNYFAIHIMLKWWKVSFAE